MQSDVTAAGTSGQHATNGAGAGLQTVYTGRVTRSMTAQAAACAPKPSGGKILSKVCSSHVAAAMHSGTTMQCNAFTGREDYRGGWQEAPSYL